MGPCCQVPLAEATLEALSIKRIGLRTALLRSGSSRWHCQTSSQAQRYPCWKMSELQLKVGRSKPAPGSSLNKGWEDQPRPGKLPRDTWSNLIPMSPAPETGLETLKGFASPQHAWTLLAASSFAVEHCRCYHNPLKGVGVGTGRGM